jgi:hypothetical protein
VGKCAGVNDKVDRLRRSSIDRAATKRSRRPLVGRFRDMIVNDVGGVSALQHSAKAIEGWPARLKRRRVVANKKVPTIIALKKFEGLAEEVH